MPARAFEGERGGGRRCHRIAGGTHEEEDGVVGGLQWVSWDDFSSLSFM